tara:strand:- start:234 stop:905 length:672 start_codon:yes stop_codon:yes gene_type:complete
MIKSLGWDTDFFGYKVGRFDVKEGVQFLDNNFIQSAFNYRLVYVFAKKNIKLNAGLKLCDTKVVFKKQSSLVKINDSVAKFNVKEHSYEELLSLALSSGKYSRFKLDNNFVNNEFEKLYQKWLDNNIANAEVYVFIKDKKVVGFVSLSFDTIAHIGLIAVDEASQGQGIGLLLVKHCETEAMKLGYPILQVVTQKENIGAMKLYEKNGFTPESETNIYHYWNK